MLVLEDKFLGENVVLSGYLTKNLAYPSFLFGNLMYMFTPEVWRTCISQLLCFSSFYIIYSITQEGGVYVQLQTLGSNMVLCALEQQSLGRNVILSGDLTSSLAYPSFPY